MVMVPNLLEISFRTVHLIAQGGTSCVEKGGAGARAVAGIMGVILKAMEV